MRQGNVRALAAVLRRLVLKARCSALTANASTDPQR